MDETQPPEDAANLESSIILPDQTENDSDTREHSVSPQRDSTESDVATPPALQEVSLDSGHVNSSDDNSELDERPADRSDENRDTIDSESLNLTPATVVLDNASSFTCKYPGCQFTSIDAETYLKHEDTHVEGGTALCDICNMRFPTYANMRRHHLYMHQGIRTFECQFCTKRFLRKEQFMEHLAGHSKPRPHECSICGGTFSFRGQLKLHLSTEHPNSVDKTCHLCDFKATSPNAVKLHYATYHLKQNLEVADNDRPQDLIRRVQVNPSDSGAIDLATVSQNFSFMGGHYPPYMTHGASVAGAGPSDLSRTSKFISVPSIVNPRTILAQAMEHSAMVPMQEEDNRHMCVSSVAGSTTVASSACQERSYARPEVVAIVPRERVSVKPEPAELAVDDSQNSVQPTSTMDLSTTDVVGTTCGNSETPCRRKIHKRSLTDDTGSESGCSPSNRHCTDSQMMQNGGMRIVHTCCRHRPYDESNSQRCREYSRHTCIAHRHSSDRRTNDSDDRSAQNDHSDEERKVFYSRATSTNLPGPGELPTHSARAAITDIQPESQAEHHNFYNRKNTIVIHDVESCTLTCVYCGIIFPDQTLYLLHRSLHSGGNSPWKCNLCGKTCKDKYDFNSHVISKGHY